MTSTLGSGIAGNRWKLLKNALLKQKQNDDTKRVSVRRFTSFNLVKTDLVQQSDDSDWFRYTFFNFAVELEVRHLKTVSTADLLSFNNTGNVCVWPSEEVLAQYCLRHSEQLRGLRICELGGGMTALAGVAVAKFCEAKTILLTDGNEKSVTNIQEILDRNRGFKCEDVRTHVLRWDLDYEDLKSGFDLIICADCLFFDEFRVSLTRTIDRLLTDTGEAWIMAPHRGKTLNEFFLLAGETFTVQVSYHYDIDVVKLHRALLCEGGDAYDPNLHFPILIRLYRKWT